MTVTVICLNMTQARGLLGGGGGGGGQEGGGVRRMAGPATDHYTNDQSSSDLTDKVSKMWPGRGSSLRYVFS
jgi:hypothetical protein